MPNMPQPGRVKWNPKLHKENVQMRTIISSIGHATENPTEVAEQELREGVEKQESYVKDTTDFINKNENSNIKITSDSIIFLLMFKKLILVFQGKNHLKLAECH